MFRGAIMSTLSCLTLSTLTLQDVIKKPTLKHCPYISLSLSFSRSFTQLDKNDQALYLKIFHISPNDTVTILSKDIILVFSKC